MSVPNLFHVVQLVFQSGNHDLTTHDGCGLFTEACARELWKGDHDFGHLKKRPGQNQFNGHAVDAVLYRPTGQSIDLVAFSETTQARPSWQEDIPRYSEADWYAPDVVAPPVDPPVDPPPPVVVDPPAPDLVLAALARIEMRQDALAAQQTADTEAIQAEIRELRADLERTIAAALPTAKLLIEKLLL